MTISAHFSQEPEAQESEVPEIQEEIPPYQCPRCGNLEARYIDGTFECLNCGHRI
jgi:transposase